MKKILVIHSSGIKSGGEMVSYNIYNRLKDLYSFSFFIPVIKEESKFDCETNIFYPKKNKYFFIIKKLKEVLKETKPDIVNVHGTRAAFLLKIVLLTTKKNFKFVYTVHGFHLAHKNGIKNKIFLFLENLTNFLFVDNLVCVGLDDYNLILKKTWSKKNVVLIKNGVEKPIEKENIEIKKIKDDSKFIILTICRLHYQKDVATLIKAVSLLNDNIKLVIIGDGPQKEKLKQIASNTEKIIFLGNQNNASSFIHYFDSFILSSNWEGLPLVILEAMLSNVLVIGSNVHGIKELIKNNVTGFLFEKSNVYNLVEKIKKSIYEKNNNKNIVDSARNFVEKEYSINNMILGYNDLYKKI